MNETKQRAVCSKRILLNYCQSPGKNAHDISNCCCISKRLFINLTVSGGDPNDVLRNLRVPQNPISETLHWVMEKVTD